MDFYSIAKVVIKPLGRFLFRTRASGLENIPPEGPVILCTNHISLLDPVVLGLYIKRRLYFMAKAELFEIPVLGFLIKKLGAFPVKRGSGDNEVYKLAFNVLEDGKVLAIFPEGTRLKQGRLPQRFKTGAALIAFSSKATIVPAAIICKGKMRLFKKNELKIGKPITFEEMGFTDGKYDNLKKISEKVRKSVVDLMG